MLRLPGLDQPPQPIYDEEFFVPHGPEASSLLPDLSHPPVAMLLIRLSVSVFGRSAFGWRLAPALAGSLLVAVFYLTAREALGRGRAALLAAGLLLCDDMCLLLSRLAMTNIFALLFQVAAVGLMLRSSREEKASFAWAAALGALNGLALGTRWTSIPLVAYLATAYAVRRGRRLLNPREVALAALSFAGLPLLVYVATYLPWLSEGHSLRDLAWLQRAMWMHHAHASAPHPYSSPWYTWPLLWRPALYLYERVGPAGQDARVLMAIGNPLLWWAAVPAALAALVRGLRGDGRALFVALGFVTTWGVWAVGPLELVFIHYFADSIVWACLALGLWLDLGLDTRARGFCLVYLALVALAFLHFYPLVTATPIPGQWFGARLWGGIYPWRWLPSWY